MVNILFALLRQDDFLDLSDKVGLQCKIYRIVKNKFNTDDV